MREFDLMVRAATAKATGEQALAAAPQPAQQPNKSDTMSRAVAWLDARDICNQPSVDEAIRNLLSDHTEDNAVAVVQAILNAAPQPAQQEHVEHTSVRRSGPHM